MGAFCYGPLVDVTLLLRAGILVPTCAYQRRDHAVVRYHCRPYEPSASHHYLLLLLPNACYVVEQQHAVIIERLGKFNRIVNAGFHMKVPVIDRKAATVSLRTMKTVLASTLRPRTT